MDTDFLFASQTSWNADESDLADWSGFGRFRGVWEHGLDGLDTDFLFASQTSWNADEPDLSDWNGF
jgi:hypothetical protein